MVLRGGRTITATPLPLQNRYGLSRRKFLNAALSANPGPAVAIAARDATRECPCIINCERVIPGTLQGHVIIGSSIFG